MSRFCDGFDFLTAGYEYIGLAVDGIITCHEPSPPAVTTAPEQQAPSVVTVVVSKSTRLITEIILGICDREDVKVFAFAGCTLMPGFIDCHVHLSVSTDDYQLDHLRLSSAEKSLRSLRAAQGLLHAGFTTLRSAGDADTYFPSFAVAKSVMRGEFIGPTIVGAGHYISVTG